jgi:molybdate transport system substrate-binding protein
MKQSRRRVTANMLLGVATCILFAIGRLHRRAVSAAEPGPAIAAASDLQFALEEIAARFKVETGEALRLTFGSSGNFARQLEGGAPFELFLSADEELVFGLAEKGLTLDRGSMYAIGRIVVFAPRGSPLKPDGQLAGLRTALARKQITRFAIANPEHAPYGRAAEQALRHAKLWEPLSPLLVLGENVAQAAQFALTGNCQGGIVAYSLALAPSMKDRGSYALIPEQWHKPLRQRMVLLREASPAVKRFYAYLQRDRARAIMKRSGFVLPAE